MFKRRKLVIVQALVLIPLAVLVLTLLQEDEYTGTASLLFRDTSGGLLDGGTSGGFVDPDRAAATNSALATLPAVADRTASTLGVDPATVEARVTVELEGSSDLATIKAVAVSPEVAAETANAYGEAYIEFRRVADSRQLSDAIALLESNRDQLSPQDLAGPPGAELNERIERLRLAESLQTGNAELVQRASAPSDPSSPNVRQNLALGLLLAAAIAAGLAALLERFDRRIRDPEELEALYGLPTLARIPRSKALSRQREKPSPADLVGQRQETEAFRTLRANLRFFNVRGELRSMLVVSPLAGDGKSTVARWLAMTMAAMGDNVVLVEADLHKGDARPGLSSVLSGDPLDSALVDLRLPFAESDGESRRLTVLPPGPSPPNASELIESDRMTELLELLEDRFDVVLIDSAALSAVSDALSLMPRVSGVLIVSALGNTTRDSAVALSKQLALVAARPLGVVANFSSVDRSAYYYSSSRSASPTSA